MPPSAPVAVPVAFSSGTYILRPADAERVECLREAGFGVAAQSLAQSLNIGPRTAPPFRVGQGVGRDD